MGTYGAVGAGVGGHVAVVVEAVVGAAVGYAGAEAGEAACSSLFECIYPMRMRRIVPVPTGEQQAAQL